MRQRNQNGRCLLLGSDDAIARLAKLIKQCLRFESAMRIEVGTLAAYSIAKSTVLQNSFIGSQDTGLFSAFL
jgi:hypothetical protein